VPRRFRRNAVPADDAYQGKVAIKRLETGRPIPIGLTSDWPPGVLLHRQWSVPFLSLGTDLVTPLSHPFTCKIKD
jgi:hypothetical protein